MVIGDYSNLQTSGDGGGGFNIGDMIMLGDDIVTHWYLMTHPDNPAANQPTIQVGTPGVGVTTASISPMILAVVALIAVALIFSRK